MKIVIMAQPDDSHMAPIKWALEQAGYQVVCWAGLSWSEEQQACVVLNGQGKLTLGSHNIESGDVVWIRRPEAPSPNPNVLEADKKFAQGE